MKQAIPLWKRVQFWTRDRDARSLPIEDARAALVSQQEQLLAEMRDLHRTSEARWKGLMERIAAMEAEGSPVDMRLLQEAQMQMRRSYERVRITHTETQELMREWEEWQRMTDLPQYVATPQHDERREMVRSELLTRGIRLRSVSVPVKQDVSEAISPAVVTEVQEIVQVSIPLVEASVPSMPDLLDEWEQFFGHESLDTDVLLEQPDTAQEVEKALERAHHLKMQATHQRLNDRSKGLRRTRLSGI